MPAKCRTALIAIFFLATAANAQTLFTYGNYKVDAAEFLRAFNKNNAKVTNKQKAMREYLDLYISSRLKVRDALDRKMDTLPQIVADVANLRSQIIDNYMNDPSILERLTKEAFQRSLKDIRVAHIYIDAPGPDTSKAFELANSILQRLKKGENFGTLAEQFSNDPSAKLNKGDLGWITVFSLPYPLENAVYSLAPGKFSSIIRSKSGYHIVKNTTERKAVGRMRAKQILLAFPPQADEAAKKRTAKTADSLYNKLIAGADFSEMAKQFSNDFVTGVTGGTMPEFGVGTYSPEFETKAWSLLKDGAISKPFATAHGYHIVQRVSVKPVVTNATDVANEQYLHSRIMNDGRWKASRDVIFNRVVQTAGLKQSDFRYEALWAFTDSILMRTPMKARYNITPTTVLFNIGDTALKVSDWISYTQTFRFNSDPSGSKSYDILMPEFLRNAAFEYYRDHLEKYNDDFRYQMNEFRDGNLFFEIMQQEIWNKAHADESKLQALYESNKAKYQWSPSADAVIFYCSDLATAQSLMSKIKKDPSRWAIEVDAVSEKVVADSSRFEWSVIPNASKSAPKAQSLTGVITKPDNSAEFAYIFKVYPQTAQRSFSEAKGLVINDYQLQLEQEWLAKLKQKYPVKIDEGVFQSISR